MSPKTIQRIAKIKEHINIYIAIITTLTSIVLGLLGYFGNRAINRLDSNQESIIKHEVKIEDHDNRITAIEENDKKQDIDLAKLKKEEDNKVKTIN